MSNYDDIIHLPHPTSKVHPRMSRQDRAAQFSPFAALTGYEAVVKETGRLTDQRAELTEEEKAVLDARLRMVLEWEGTSPEVSITYFQPDARKSGGSYLTTQGYIKKVEKLKRVLVMEDGGEIPIDQIASIDSPILTSVE